MKKLDEQSFKHGCKTVVQKKKYFAWIIALSHGLAGTVGGCSNHEPSPSSEPFQLTDNNFACDQYGDPQKKEHLQTMPERFINEASFRVGNIEDVRNQLTGIPLSLMSYLFDVHRQNGLSISEAPLGGSTIGETLLVGFQRSNMVPRTIRITNRPNAIVFALQHEVGHAVEGEVRRLKPLDPMQWQQAFNEGRGNRKIRSYAKSQVGEYFAEAFANFYCSRAAHDFIKDELPLTYGQLKNVLPPPIWEETIEKKQTEIYVFVDDENPAQVYLYVSLPEGVSSLQSCQSDLTLDSPSPTCPGDVNQNNIQFETVDLAKNNRVFMKSKGPVDPSILERLTLVALNQKGEKIRARSLKIKENS